ncbi:hypothetical protein [Cryobacterium sp. Sr3]|uniref:hypothetical protein n=1 Tax=Cryobacterium sp. Sr3 TaxID=1259194 RepID=UPI00106BA13C|nr:hypothetical protein [Cryobacterium sp. Sr3]TFB59649.1 hypothetical protein E3N94_03355 [Cryobacterium sp. Sr3]
MLEWGNAVNGWDVLFTSVVQAGIVILTGMLTWILTRGSERRRASKEAIKDKRVLLEQYSRDLMDLCDLLEDMAARQTPISNESLRPFNRFQDRVTWIPQKSDRAVDSWVRTRLSRCIGLVMDVVNSDLEGDSLEYEVHQTRAEISEISEKFTAWIDRKLGPEWFAGELIHSSMIVYHQRIASPEEMSLTRWEVMRGVFSRFRYQLGEAWNHPIKPTPVRNVEANDVAWLSGRNPQA